MKRNPGIPASSASSGGSSSGGTFRLLGLEVRWIGFLVSTSTFRVL